MYQLIDGGNFVVAEAFTLSWAKCLQQDLGGDLYIRHVKFSRRHGNGGIYPTPHQA
jgi:hypothetical protein